MVKRRADELVLDPDEGPGVRDKLTSRVLEALEEMRSSGDFDWCDDFLRDVGDTIEASNRVTERQLQAINNIRDKRG